MEPIGGPALEAAKSNVCFAGRFTVVFGRETRAFYGEPVNMWTWYGPDVRISWRVTRPASGAAGMFMRVMVRGYSEVDWVGSGERWWEMRCVSHCQSLSFCISSGL